MDLTKRVTGRRRGREITEETTSFFNWFALLGKDDKKEKGKKGKGKKVEEEDDEESEVEVELGEDDFDEEVENMVVIGEAIAEDLWFSPNSIPSLVSGELKSHQEQTGEEEGQGTAQKQENEQQTQLTRNQNQHRQRAISPYVHFSINFGHLTPKLKKKRFD
eukprot:TRINITY_DN3013_c0_g1_i1.p1 TRINITY_DN3013_c0_g1~~TRINITY_DN3013_c0_g1_i1.p1  ORF type:complete len:162 (+),score=64.38 TRINITY_DN3013_c0_g1_i1:678-1163(+)